MKLLLTALSLFLLAAPATAQETLTGTVTHVRDGDTIEVADVPVRLNGVAAPELDEPRGREGKKFMARLVAGKTVRCELNGERSYDRVIGIVTSTVKILGRPLSPPAWRGTVPGSPVAGTTNSTPPRRSGCRCLAIASGADCDPIAARSPPEAGAAQWC
jgi:hypothetical protein